MIDITTVDGLEMNMKPRFEVVYHFKSLTHASRIRIKVPLEEDDCRIASTTNIWESADWYERECFDMFGIIFEGHPDLKRILMYEEFEGHPLAQRLSNRQTATFNGTQRNRGTTYIWERIVNDMSSTSGPNGDK